MSVTIYRTDPETDMIVFVGYFPDEPLETKAMVYTSPPEPVYIPIADHGGIEIYFEDDDE